MTSFESIFASNTNTKSNLDALFKNSKSKANPNTKSILDAIVQNDEIKNVSSTDGSGIVAPTSTRKLTRNKKKINRFTNETESRTIFVGNLPNTTKKEVFTFPSFNHLNNFF
jgi:hypothetical protein